MASSTRPPWGLVRGVLAPDGRSTAGHALRAAHFQASGGAPHPPSPQGPQRYADLLRTAGQARADPVGTREQGQRGRVRGGRHPRLAHRKGKPPAIVADGARFLRPPDKGDQQTAEPPWAQGTRLHLGAQRVGGGGGGLWPGSPRTPPACGLGFCQHPCAEGGSCARLPVCQRGDPPACFLVTRVLPPAAGRRSSGVWLGSAYSVPDIKLPSW